MRLPLLLMLIVLSTACSFHWQDDQGIYQHRGLIWYTLTETERVRFFEMSSLGLQIRLQAEDSGFTLGYRKYIALQPPQLTKTDEDTSTSGMFIGSENLSVNAALLFRKQVGLEAGAGLLINGVSVGYAQTVIVEGPQNNEAIIKKIDFYEHEPLSTFVFQSTGE